MLVSAISMCDTNINNTVPFYLSKKSDNIADTAFNSLTPYTTKKTNSIENTPAMYDNIDKWQSFCHDRLLGNKLNILA